MLSTHFFFSPPVLRLSSTVPWSISLVRPSDWQVQQSVYHQHINDICLAATDKLDVWDRSELEWFYCTQTIYLWGTVHPLQQVMSCWCQQVGPMGSSTPHDSQSLLRNVNKSQCGLYNSLTCGMSTIFFYTVNEGSALNWLTVTNRTWCVTHILSTNGLHWHNWQSRTGLDASPIYCQKWKCITSIDSHKQGMVRHRYTLNEGRPFISLTVTNAMSCVTHIPSMVTFHWLDRQSQTKAWCLPIYSQWRKVIYFIDFIVSREKDVTHHPSTSNDRIT